MTQASILAATQRRLEIADVREAHDALDLLERRLDADTWDPEARTAIEKIRRVLPPVEI